MFTENKNRLKAKPVIALVIANLVPLGGVLFFSWSLFSILFLYWLENIIIGAYNILRMSKSVKEEGNVITVNNRPVRGKTPVILFFIFHFGLFTFGHGVALFSIFGQPNISVMGVATAFIVLIISHGISYRLNFIEKKEYLNTSAGRLLFLPYGRVFVMHILVLICGNIINNLGYTIIAAAGVIILKIILDVLSHFFEHIVLISKLKAANPLVRG